MTQLPGDPGTAPTEPALTAGTITAAVTAVLTLLVAFAIPISDAQQTAILGVVAVVAPFVAGWAARGRVYSPATVARLLQRQAR